MNNVKESQPTKQSQRRDKRCRDVGIKEMPRKAGCHDQILVPATTPEEIALEEVKQALQGPDENSIFNHTKHAHSPQGNAQMKEQR